MKSEMLDDPFYEYQLVQQVQKYLPAVRKWWADYENRVCTVFTGTYDVTDYDAPYGLLERRCMSPKKSPLPGIQMFPFIPTTYFDIVAPGGLRSLITRLCSNGLIVEEFTLIEKHNSPGTYHQGQFIILVPTERLKNITDFGRYVYLTRDEMTALSKSVVLPSLLLKVTHDTI